MTTFSITSIMLAGFIPYIWTVYAKMGGPGYDNVNPRAFHDKTDGRRRWALWAQDNSFEAFPFFAAGVIVANIRHVDVTKLHLLCVAFLALRIMYGVFYIAGQSTLRSAVWFAAYLCNLALFLYSL